MWWGSSFLAVMAILTTSSAYFFLFCFDLLWCELKLNRNRFHDGNPSELKKKMLQNLWQKSLIGLEPESELERTCWPYPWKNNFPFPLFTVIYHPFRSIGSYYKSIKKCGLKCEHTAQQRKIVVQKSQGKHWRSNSNSVFEI